MLFHRGMRLTSSQLKRLEQAKKDRDMDAIKRKIERDLDRNRQEDPTERPHRSDIIRR